MRGSAARLALALLLPLTQAEAAQLSVRIRPLWQGRPLMMNEVGLTRPTGGRVSVTRLAMLLSRARLRDSNGRWIGAEAWAEFVDAGSGRLSFRLDGIPAGVYSAFRFDLGLDEKTDRAEVTRWPASHPLNPSVNGLHWSWRGGHVFCAVEGRHELSGGQIAGYSFHLAGQACRGTVEVPVQIDLTDRPARTLVLNLHADRFFDAVHAIDLSASDSTHSADDDPLAARLADNAIHMFGLEQVTPEGLDVSTQDAPGAEIPGWLRERIPAQFPRMKLPADNPLTKAGAALGRTLFHDVRLSSNNRQSCASCHDATHALSDARRFSLGAEGRAGTRQAMPLFNLAWKPAYFWDGRSPSLRDQVLRPIQDPDEMHETLPRAVAKVQDLGPAFASAFGSNDITPERIARALEQHLLTLVSGSSPMDRTVTEDSKLSAREQRGFTLFFTESDPGRGIRGADCFHCHGGALFSNHQFLNNGLDADEAFKDEGRARVTGLRADRGRFMVPSLRNIALTAPYMHDGRFATLEEVIEHYDHGIRPSSSLDPNLAKQLRHGGLGLSQEDKDALVAFLKSLTDDAFARESSP